MGGDESNYPVTLSDWINFLMSIINNYEKKFGDNTTTVFTIGATVLSIFSLSLSTISLALVFAERGFEVNITSINNTLLGLAIVLAIISVILVSVAFYQKISKKSRYAKACNLLQKIMKGEVIEPRKVRDAWFEEGEKKMNFWKTLSYGIIGLSFILTIIGYLGFDIARTYAIAILAIGITLFALAQSEDMELKLSSLGEESNRKLTTIANATFMEIVDIFEDKRIQFVQHPEWLGLEGTIWKCETYIERAYDLYKSTHIDDKNRQRLFRWFDKLINESGLNWETGERRYKASVLKEGKFVEVEKLQVLQKEDVGNIIKMIEKFKDFELNDKNKCRLLDTEKKVDGFKKKNK